MFHQPTEPVDDNVAVCVLSSNGGDLVCCDGCPASYNYRCIGQSPRTVTDGKWLCPECTFGGRHEAAGARLPPLKSLNPTYLPRIQGMLLIKYKTTISDSKQTRF